jgi:N-acetylneuraminic acid mutarotase
MDAGTVDSGSTGGNAGTGGTGGGPGQEDDAGMEPTGNGTPTHEERMALRTVRQEHGAAALNGEVYVLGGFTPDVTSSVQAYDPEGNTWRDVADFPAQFHHPNVAVVEGLLYVVGFHVGMSLRDADGRVFAYDPAENEWLPRMSMPLGTERGSACVATLGTKIYLFGGASDVTLPDASAYDTMLDDWEQLPLMPELREHCQAAGIDGKVYIVSGRSGSIQGLEVESWVYDPDAQSYQERAAIPTPRGGAAGAVLGGRIFVFGGEGNADDPDGVFHEVEAYDPVSNTWESLPDMLIARHGYAAATVGDRIYLPGGATNQGFGATNNHTVFFFQAAD